MIWVRGMPLSALSSVDLSSSSGGGTARQGFTSGQVARASHSQSTPCLCCTSHRVCTYMRATLHICAHRHACTCTHVHLRRALAFKGIMTHWAHRVHLRSDGVCAHLTCTAHASATCTCAEVLPFGNFVLDTLHTNTSLGYWFNACMLHINVILAFASPFAEISQEWVTAWLSHMQLDLDWQLKSPAHHSFSKEHTFPLPKIQSYSNFKTQQNARLQLFWDASCNLGLQHLFSSARQDSQLFANSTCPNSHFWKHEISCFSPKVAWRTTILDCSQLLCYKLPPALLCGDSK